MRYPKPKTRARILMLLCAIILLQLCQCSDKYRYMYSKPQATIYDTSFSTYKMINENDDCSFVNHLITIYLPVIDVKMSWASPFASKAYAVERFPKQETIDSIRIITLNDYNAQFPAGSDISDSCSFFNTYRLVDTGNYGHVAFVAYSKQAFLSRIKSLSGNNFPQQYLAFHINVTPNGVHSNKFAILYHTTMSSTLSDTTISFYLKP